MFSLSTGAKTTEFWITLAITVAKTIWPDLPNEAIYAVIAYVLSRTAVKTLTRPY